MGGDLFDRCQVRLRVGDAAAVGAPSWAGSGPEARVDLSDEATELRELRREIRALRQANEILWKESAYFAQAGLGRRLRR